MKLAGIRIGILLYMKVPVLVQVNIKPLEGQIGYGSKNKEVGNNNLLTTSTALSTKIAARVGQGPVLMYPLASFKQSGEAFDIYDMKLEFNSEVDWHYSEEYEAPININNKFDFEMSAVSAISKGLGLESGLVLRQVPTVPEKYYLSPQLVTIKDRRYPVRNMTFFQPLNAIDSIIRVGENTVYEAVNRILSGTTQLFNTNAQRFLRNLELTPQASDLINWMAKAMVVRYRPTSTLERLQIRLVPGALNAHVDVQISISRSRYGSDCLFHEAKNVTLQNEALKRKMTGVYSRNALEVFQTLGYATTLNNTRLQFNLASPYGVDLRYLKSLRKPEDQVPLREDVAMTEKEYNDAVYLHGMMPILFDHPEFPPSQEPLTIPGPALNDDQEPIAFQELDEQVEQIEPDEGSAASDNNIMTANWEFNENTEQSLLL